MGPAAIPCTLRGAFCYGVGDPLPARLSRSRTHQARANSTSAKNAPGLIQRRLIKLAFSVLGMLFEEPTPERWHLPGVAS
jgi:hypothetical protein